MNLYGFCGNDGINGYDVLGLSPAQSSSTYPNLSYLPIAQQIMIENAINTYGHNPMGFQLNEGQDPDPDGWLGGTTENNPPASDSPGFLDSNASNQTRTYTLPDGKTYVVTNDPNATAPAGTTSYNVTAGGGVPMGFTTNGQIVSLGVVGDESDPEPIPNAPSSSTLGDIDPSNYSAVLTGMTTSADTWDYSNPQQRFGAIVNAFATPSIYGGSGTLQVGISHNGQYGPVNVNFNVGIVIAATLNIAIYNTYTPGTALGAGSSSNGGISFAFSNASSIYDLAGPFAFGSASGGAGGAMSLETFNGQGGSGPFVYGGGFTIGFGEGASSAAGVNQTTIYSLF